MKSNQPRSSRPLLGAGKQGVDAHAAYLLRQAAGALRGAMDHALGPAGITNPQFAVLAMLSLHPGASGADLARWSQLTPQTLTVITRNLAAARLIRRGMGVAGQRQIPYELTEGGHAVLAQGKRAAAQIEAEILEGFSPAETSVIKRWLVEVERRLHAPKNCPGTGVGTDG